MLRSTLAGLVVCSLIAHQASAAVIIDDFNTGNGSVTAGAGGSDSDTSAAASAIGGSRDLDIPGGVPVSGSGSLTIEANAASNGRLTFSLDALTDGSGFLTWGSLAGVDLTDGGGASFFTFEIVSIDQGMVDLIVGVEETAGAGGTSDTFTLSNAGAGTQQFNFSVFDATIDFTAIEEITLEIQGEAASDLVLDEFLTDGEREPVIPEPSSIFVFGLMFASAGLPYFGRRRRP